MLKNGLVSVSFRQLCCEEIIRLAKNAGLEAIEWGGDVHAPPDDPERAKKIGEMTRESGLTVSSYGSYYRLGAQKDNYPDCFGKVLDTAVLLGAPVIRIWAGEKGSEETSPEKRREMVNEARELSRLAGKRDITLAFECHGGTLTDCRASSVRLMEEINSENCMMYWQPNNLFDFEENLRFLGDILPRLINIHVFNWPVPGIRKPLSEGKDKWMEYLRLAARDNKDRFCLLEFMPDDSPEALTPEARELKSWLGEF